MAECFILSLLNYKIIVNWWKKKADKSQCYVKFWLWEALRIFDFFYWFDFG